MMKNKIIVRISKAVLAIAFLNIFAWSVYYVNNGGNLGFMTNPIKKFSEFPSLIFEVGKEVKKPEIFFYRGKTADTLNELGYDLYAINSSFEDNQWITSLKNLKTGSTLLKWHLSDTEYIPSKRIFSHTEPRSPVLLADSSLVLHCDETKNLYRLNSKSEIVWHNTEYQFHHGLNQDHEGNIWACTRNIVKYQKQNLKYWDNQLTKIDVKTGKTLYHQSLSKILIDNNLTHYLYGFTNDVPKHGNDPLHLNEIEPVLKDGPYWKKGDVFISCRHRSVIFLYRPSTNKVLRVIHGPFYNQHDVDIVSDSTISVFNNNNTCLNGVSSNKKRETDPPELMADTNINNISGVLLYQMKDSTFSSLYAHQFRKENIFQETQGTHHLLPNGDLFVEEHDNAKLFIFNEDKLIYRNNDVFNHSSDGFVQYTHWIRIYENLDFLK